MKFVISPASFVDLLFQGSAPTFSHQRSALAMSLPLDPVSTIRTAGWGHQLAKAFADVVRPATVVLRTVRHPLFTLTVSLAFVPGSLGRESAAPVRLTVLILRLQTTPCLTEYAEPSPSTAVPSP